ncbi:MAG: OadG family protein [Candidatus Krumholzibacteriota bacterium]|nr:OadG family protein [Candidatus Krumholzibacteriota bacterium]
MLTEGLGLMAAGMGMVFAFLLLMVLVMNVSARIFRHFSVMPADLPSDSGNEERRPDNSTGNPAEIALAIALAVTREGQGKDTNV